MQPRYSLGIQTVVNLVLVFISCWERQQSTWEKKKKRPMDWIVTFVWHIPCFQGSTGDKECIYFAERERGQGKKGKLEDCAIMAFLNPSGKFMFRVLWKSRAQLFKERLPGDSSPDSTVLLDLPRPYASRHLHPQSLGRAGRWVRTLPWAGLRLPPVKTADLK